MKINLDKSNIKINPNIKEVDHTAWVSMDYINSLTHYSSTGAFKSKLYTEEGRVYEKSCEVSQIAPYYPNRIGEGLGEAHWMSLKHLYNQKNIIDSK